MTKANLTTKNTAFFSTCDDNYALYAATSLMIIREHCPGANLYLIGKHFSNATKKHLKKYHINYCEVDLTEEFPRSWQYPAECYYLFAGPELLLKEGFKYSVYLDGDVLCMDDPLKLEAEITGATAVAANRYNEILHDDLPIIKNLWQISPERLSHKRLNSGVVYFNNAQMKKRALLQNASKIFIKSLKNGVPRKGDDSLFALTQLVAMKDTDLELVNPRYNFMPIYYGFEATDGNLTFFHFDGDKPWKDLAYFHYDERYNTYNNYVKIWRDAYKKYFFKNWLKTVPKIQTISQKIVTIKNRHLTKQELMLPEDIRMANASKPPIKVYWFRNEAAGLFNFGDELSVDLIQKIFGYRVDWAPVEICELIAVGSIIEIAENAKNKNRIKVWGSGFIKKGKSSGSNLDFSAVRGTLSKTRIKKDVPMGDPGILANLIYEPSKEKTDKIGVIAHYIDYDLPLIKQLRTDNRFLIINPLDKPANVAKQITSCKMILSSSLHGLIFADSFGIPNFHLPLSKRVTGGIYKFHDYCSGVGKPYQAINPAKIKNQDYLNQLIKTYQPISNLKAKQRALIKAFPINHEKAT